MRGLIGGLHRMVSDLAVWSIPARHFSASKILSLHCEYCSFLLHQLLCFPMRRLARGRRGEVVLLWFSMPWWQWAIQKVEQDTKLMVNVPWGRKRSMQRSTSSNTCCKSYQKLLLCTSAGKPRLLVKRERRMSYTFPLPSTFFLTSLPDLTTLLINSLPLSFFQPSLQGRIHIYFFPPHHSFKWPLSVSLSQEKEQQRQTLQKQMQNPPPLPLSDSQLQRSISSALKDGVSSGVGRGSVSGLPVDTFKDFTHMSVLLKYF